MEGNTESSSVPLDVVQPETDFADFFLGIICKLYDLKNKKLLNNVKTVLKDIILKNKNDSWKNPPHFSFKLSQVRCAYLFTYSVLHSIIVYAEFSKFLKQSKMFYSLCKVSLKICCLGGGPGVEAVAICRSLRDKVLEPYLANPSSFIEVHFTMVDILPHWKTEQSEMMNAINDSSNVLHSKRIILHSNFLKTDILKPFTKSLREKIEEADIVAVVNHDVSAQENSKEGCAEKLQLMMENVIESMREDSCLFILDDTIGRKVFNNVIKHLRDKEPNSRLKISMDKEYKLERSTINKFEDMMKLKKDPSYHPVLPTLKSKASSCMWVKNISVFSDNSTAQDENDAREKSSITNLVTSSKRRNREVSSASQSNGVPGASNEDVMTYTKNSKKSKPPKKNKRDMKKKTKQKTNNRTISLIVSMIVHSMLLRRHRN